MADNKDAELSSDRDPEDIDSEEPEPEGLDPEDVSPEDHFFLNGRPLAFDLFVIESMRRIADRDPIEPQPQPTPAPKDVIWASRRLVN